MGGRRLLCSLDGRVVLRRRAAGDDPVVLGEEVAAHLLDRAGGAALLADLRSADLRSADPRGADR